MPYYIYYKTDSSSSSIYPLGQRELMDFTSQATSIGKAMVKGQMHSFNNLQEFHIYEIPTELHIDGFVRAMQQANHVDSYGNVVPNVLKEQLRDVTNEFANPSLIDFLLGKGKQNSPTITSNSLYVDQNTLQEIIRLRSSKFDFRKLTTLLNELNEAYKANLIFSTGMLLRAIIDHIPPIFGHTNFSNFASQYSSSGNVRSFKAQMLILNDFKNSADSALHSQIRKTEKIPAMIQFEKKTELDVLLQEIIRITEEESKGNK